MYTSHYGVVKSLVKSRPDLKPVCISRGKPRWYTGEVELALAPTWAMLKMSLPEYNRHFEAILDRLSAQELYARLGENAVLLCWEKPGECCHRRRVAEWFEASIPGLSIPEWGFVRSQCPAYDDLPLKVKAG